MSQKIPEILKSHQLLIVCGTGGVGKTTLSTVLGLEAARLGQRVLVITMDPARRLKQSLGLEALGDTPLDLSPHLPETLPGAISAMMPESRSSFRRFLESLQPTISVDSLLSNPFFEMFSQEFSGANEYLALQELLIRHESKKYDLIVLDTPPAPNTRAFLVAPDVLTGFLEDRFVQWLGKPSSEWVSRGISMGLRVSLQILERLTGKHFMTNFIQMATLLSEIQPAFLRRLQAIRQMLQSQTTGILVVTGAQQATSTEELQGFLEVVRERNFHYVGSLTNRSLLRLVSAEEISTLPPVLRSLLETESRQTEVGFQSPAHELARFPELSRDAHGIGDLWELSKGLRAVLLLISISILGMESGAHSSESVPLSLSSSDSPSASPSSSPTSEDEISRMTQELQRLEAEGATSLLEKKQLAFFERFPTQARALRYPEKIALRALDRQDWKTAKKYLTLALQDAGGGIELSRHYGRVLIKLREFDVALAWSFEWEKKQTHVGLKIEPLLLRYEALLGIPEQTGSIQILERQIRTELSAASLPEALRSQAYFLFFRNSLQACRRPPMKGNLLWTDLQYLDQWSERLRCFEDSGLSLLKDEIGIEYFREACRSLTSEIQEGFRELRNLLDPKSTPLIQEMAEGPPKPLQLQARTEIFERARRLGERAVERMRYEWKVASETERGKERLNSPEMRSAWVELQNLPSLPELPKKRAK